MWASDCTLLYEEMQSFALMLYATCISTWHICKEMACLGCLYLPTSLIFCVLQSGIKLWHIAILIVIEKLLWFQDEMLSCWKNWRRCQKKKLSFNYTLLESIHRVMNPITWRNWNWMLDSGLLLWTAVCCMEVTTQLGLSWSIPTNGQWTKVKSWSCAFLQLFSQHSEIFHCIDGRVYWDWWGWGSPSGWRVPRSYPMLPQTEWEACSPAIRASIQSDWAAWVGDLWSGLQVLWVCKWSFILLDSLWRISAGQTKQDDATRLEQEELDVKCLQLLRAIIHNEVVKLPNDWEDKGHKLKR